MRSKSFWALMTVIVVTALALVPSSLSASDSVTAADAAAGDALDSALAYVNSHPADLGVTSADVADLYATSIVKSRHSGVTHVNLNQRFQGLEVFDAHATVNVAADGGSSSPPAHSCAVCARPDRPKPFSTPQTPLRLPPPVSSLAEPVNLRILEEDDGEALVSSGGISHAAIPAQLGWQPTSNGLRLAWQVTIDDSSARTCGMRRWTPGRASSWTRRTGRATTRSRTSRRSPASGARRSSRRRACRSRRTPWSTGRATASTSSRRRARTTRARRAGAEPGRRARFAVRLARHQRRPRGGVHDHAREQRTTRISTRTTTSCRTSGAARTAVRGSTSTSRPT